MAKSCYWCGQPATSKEHVPARCYFPDDDQYKKNLITVPACTMHNEDTSKDDEYSRNIITMHFGNNSLAFTQFINKTAKSFQESPALLKVTTGNRMRVIIDDKKSSAIQIDRERFDRTMKKISYALFFHEYKHPWDRELIIMTKDLFTDTLQADEFGKLVEKMGQVFPDNDFNGSNPMVFKYQFCDSSPTPVEVNEKMLRIIFYEGFQIWVTILNGSKLPSI